MTGPELPPEDIDPDEQPPEEPLAQDEAAAEDLDEPLENEPDSDSELELENPADLDERGRWALLCALLFSSGEVVDSSRLGDFLSLDAEGLDELVETQQASLEELGLGVQKVAGGYRMVSSARWSPLLSLFHRKVRKARLSRSALEILAIIAYEQPVSRTRVDELRQVNSESSVRALIERRLITIAGRAETPGRPFLYRTTTQFLETFGLVSLDDLPPRPATLDFAAGERVLEGPFASAEELESLEGDEGPDDAPEEQR